MRKSVAVSSKILLIYKFPEISLLRRMSTLSLAGSVVMGYEEKLLSFSESNDSSLSLVTYCNLEAELFSGVSYRSNFSTCLDTSDSETSFFL